MQERTEILRSPAALNYQIIWFSIAYFILAVVSIFILIVPARFFDGNVTVWFLVLSIIAILLYMLSVGFMKRTWRTGRYFLAKDCLIITNGAIGTREDVYRYETIASVSMQQNQTEKTRGYARFILALNGGQQLVLKDVIKPNEILDTLQGNIVTASRKSVNT